MNSSYGRWGMTEQPIDVPPPVGLPAEEPGIFSLAAGYLPVAQALAATLQDKYRVMLKAQEKLNRARATGMPRDYIRRLEVNYNAARRAYEKQREGERSTRQYRLLGQVGATVGIGIGVAVIFAILYRTLRS